MRQPRGINEIKISFSEKYIHECVSLLFFYSFTTLYFLQSSIFNNIILQKKTWMKLLETMYRMYIWSTLPKSNSHKTNIHLLKWNVIQLLFSSFSIVLTPHKSNFLKVKAISSVPMDSSQASEMTVYHRSKHSLQDLRFH